MREQDDTQDPTGITADPDRIDKVVPLSVRVDNTLDQLPGFKIDPALEGQEANLIRSRQEFLRGVLRPMYFYLLGSEKETEEASLTFEKMIQALIDDPSLALNSELISRIKTDYLENIETPRDWQAEAPLINIEGDTHPLLTLRKSVIAVLPDNLRAELTRAEMPTST